MEVPTPAHTTCTGIAAPLTFPASVPKVIDATLLKSKLVAADDSDTVLAAITPQWSRCLNADGLLWAWHPAGRVDIMDQRTGDRLTLAAFHGERSTVRPDAPLLALHVSDSGVGLCWQAGWLMSYRNEQEGPLPIAWQQGDGMTDIFPVEGHEEVQLV